MIDAPPSLAVQRRRTSRRQEWGEQTRLAARLRKYLDPADTFWTSLENKPISRVSGLFQKRRGVRSGLPDVQVIWRGKPIFIELKSRAGVASKAQKQVRLEMLPAGASWWMARSARAAMMALYQNSQTLTHAACCPTGTSIAKMYGGPMGYGRRAQARTRRG
jgi:hypothetical protein